MAFNFLISISRVFNKIILGKSRLFVFAFILVTFTYANTNEGLSKSSIAKIRQSFCNSLLRSKARYKVIKINFIQTIIKQ